MTPGLDDYLRKGRGGEGQGEEPLTLVSRDVLNEILERLERIEERLNRLEDEVRELRKRGVQTARTRDDRGAEARRHRASAFQRALDAMNEKGYVSVRGDLSGLGDAEVERALTRLEQMGGVKIDLGEDVIVVHPTVYREFKARLEEVRERDPVACVELFGRAGRLFNELYRRGAIYYDSKKNVWRMV